MEWWKVSGPKSQLLALVWPRFLHATLGKSISLRSDFFVCEMWIIVPTYMTRLLPRRPDYGGKEEHFVNSDVLCQCKTLHKCLLNKPTFRILYRGPGLHLSLTHRCGNQDGGFEIKGTDRTGYRGPLIWGHPSALRLIYFAPERNPQRSLPKYRSHSVLTKARHLLSSFSC